METTSDNRLIAAHLTAALLARLPNGELPVDQAVSLFNEVLEELNKGTTPRTVTLPSHFYE